MICLRTSPKNPAELYEFFKDIARPPVKSHVAYIGGTPYIRENWMIYTYLTKSSNIYSLWFYYGESESAKWYETYQQYIKEN